MNDSPGLPLGSSLEKRVKTRVPSNLRYPQLAPDDLGANFSFFVQAELNIAIISYLACIDVAVSTGSTRLTLDTHRASSLALHPAHRSSPA